MLSLRGIRDEDLLHRLSELVKQSRGVEAEVVAHIGEVEFRRLHAREACSSMFEYCRRILCLRENEAYLRITVARAAREHPVLLEMLRDGRLHLSGIARLAPHLTLENAHAVLKRACGRSHREIRELVAELEPKPDVAAAVRKLPERPASGCGSPLQLGAPRVERDAPNPESDAVTLESRVAAPAGSRVAAPVRPPVVEPLAPTRYQVRFTASVELRDKLERLQALMRSSVPDGDLARIIEIAVSEKLQRVEAKRFGQTKAPRSGYRRHRHESLVTSHPRRGEATGARARLRSLCLQGQVRTPLRQAPRPRVSPQAPLRSRRRPQPRQPDPHVQGPQHPLGGAGLRRGRHGTVPSGDEPYLRAGGRLWGSDCGEAALASLRHSRRGRVGSRPRWARFTVLGRSCLSPRVSTHTPNRTNQRRAESQPANQRRAEARCPLQLGAPRVESDAVNLESRAVMGAAERV